MSSEFPVKMVDDEENHSVLSWLSGTADQNVST